MIVELMLIEAAKLQAAYDILKEMSLTNATFSVPGYLHRLEVLNKQKTASVFKATGVDLKHSSLKASYNSLIKTTPIESLDSYTIFYQFDFITLEELAVLNDVLGLGNYEVKSEVFKVFEDVLTFGKTLGDLERGLLALSK